ncbi:MAG: cbb3-type cytochrome oxidase assembly protein CcoS [Ignavibacteriaceae bacterium]|nr:cbb3-type cytochrome oxidase assembly protein CcoS [Ignavibacteriaceae bacterium]
MSVIVVLISFSLLIAIGFLIAFLMSVRSGQFDDKYTPSVRILLDDKKTDNNINNSNINKENS